MRIQNIVFYLLVATLLSSCATGKTINKVGDIQDDGESNVVVLSYDVKLYTTEKYPTVKKASLKFHCPENSTINRNNCFSLSVPYKGKSEYDGYELHTFESSGSKVMRIKYNALSVTSGQYRVLIDEQKTTDCTFNKKKKKNICVPRTLYDHDTHNFRLPETIPLAFTPGTGCYMGHLSLILVNDNLNEYDFELDAALTSEKLANLDSGVSAAIQNFVDRPCY